MKRKPPRTYSEEFKREAVNLVINEGYRVSEAARNLGIHENRIDQELVLDATMMALDNRRPESGAALLHHSDRGSQYASAAFQELLQRKQIAYSMSRKGNCWDNAVMESFFATLKKERIHHEQYATRANIFDYIERFYNRQWRHSALGNLSPEEFETAN